VRTEHKQSASEIILTVINPISYEFFAQRGSKFLQ
jgi:hypothetical protein